MPISQLDPARYQAVQAFVGPDGVGVYVVTGDGVRIYVREDDQAMIDQLVNTPVVELSVATPSFEAAATPSPIAELDPATATPADIVSALQQQFG